jgi:hypothetical protein
MNAAFSIDVDPALDLVRIEMSLYRHKLEICLYKPARLQLLSSPRICLP